MNLVTTARQHVLLIEDKGSVNLVTTARQHVLLVEDKQTGTGSIARVLDLRLLEPCNDHGEAVSSMRSRRVTASTLQQALALSLALSRSG